MKYWYVIAILLLVSWAPHGEISNNEEKEQLDCSCSEYDNCSVIGTNIRFGKNGVSFQCATVIGLMWQMKTEKMNMKNLTLAVSLKKAKPINWRTV
jgi:hypothetical protein